MVSLAQRLTFGAVEAALLPVSAIGAGLFAARAAVSARAAGISITAYGPITARALLDVGGTRPDPRARALLRALPTTSALAWDIAVAPTRLAVALSGHTPGPLHTPDLGEAGFADIVTVRTRTIDELVDGGIGGRPWPQLVVLGAGNDTRAQYLDPATAAFELDRAPTQRNKRAAVRAAGLDDTRVRYVGVDLAERVWFDDLVAAGFDPTAPALVVWEGVSMYLRETDVRATLTTVAQRCAPGSVIVFDALTERALPRAGLARIATAAAQATLTLIGEPMRWALAATADAAETVLAECGLSVARIDELGPKPSALVVAGRV